MNRILGPEEIQAAIERLADQIRERTAGKNVALVGIRSRGDEVAARLGTLLAAR